MAINFEKCKVPADRKVNVKKVLSTIKVDKPSKTAFFQICTLPGYEPVDLFIYAEEKAGVDNNAYIVQDEACLAYLQDLQVLTPARFYFYQVFGTNIFKLDWVSLKTDKNGNINRYHSSRMEAYEIAKAKWVRMAANQEGGFYEYAFALDELPPPDWEGAPKTIFDALEIAFKGFIIDQIEHPIIKKLKGKL